MIYNKEHKLFLFITTVLSFFYFLWGINDWKFSYVGDMWAFYRYAQALYTHNFLVYPFSFKGVFSFNSVLASLYQAFFFLLPTTPNVSWRLSNIILIFPLSYFFYRWLRVYFRWETATLSTLLLQSSFYLSLFFKIGYINPQALVLFVMSLYYAALSGKFPTKRNGIVLGLLLGISFYIYVGPIFPLLIWPYLLPLRKKLRDKQTLLFIGWLIRSYLGILFLIVPGLSSIGNPTTKTVLHSEFIDFHQLFINIWNNFFVFYYPFKIIPTHFIPFAYLDTVSQILALIGTIVILRYCSQPKFGYLLLTYSSTCVVLGIINPYVYPSITRGMFLLLFGFIFAGYGLTMLYRKKNWAGGLILPLLLCSIIGLNIYQSHFANFKKIGYTGIALLFKEIEEAHTSSHKSLVFVLSANEDINYYLFSDLSTMLHAFTINDVSLFIIRPYSMNCDFLKNKTVLFLSYDTAASAMMKTYHCPQYSYTVKALETPITYY